MDAFMAMQAGGKPDMGALAVDDSPLMPQPDLPPVDGMVEVAGHKFTPDVADHVEQIMSAVDGLKVVSGGRDAHTNRIHRGVVGSLHLDGRAVDFSGPLALSRKRRVLADSWVPQRSVSTILGADRSCISDGELAWRQACSISWTSFNSCVDRPSRAAVWGRTVRPRNRCCPPPLGAACRTCRFTVTC